MTIDNWFALISAFGVLLFNAVFATWYVSNKDAAIEKTLREKIENIYNLAITKLEAVSEKESKGRHDLANEVQRQVGMLVMDDKALSQRINDLSADVVRKSDLAAVEARMMAFLQKLDGKFDELMRGDRTHS